MKILNRKEFAYLELMEWTTQIDLFADMTFLKRVLVKGIGSSRCES